MKKILFGDCHRLYLCLILPVMLSSCAVKHGEGSAGNYRSTGSPDTVWKIEVVMMPVIWMSWDSDNQVRAVLMPYNIKRVGCSGNTQIFQLSFRVNTDRQLNVLREHLFATGMVEQVNVTKESN